MERKEFDLPNTDALFLGGQAWDINFAHAGHIGP